MTNTVPAGESRSPRLYWLALGILGAFAFLFNWAVGHRGIYLLDQSMIFDGGWRILQGQIPYKDFLIPFFPGTFYLQAAFFRIFGVNWSAMVLPACCFSVIGTLSIIRIVRLLSGGSVALALIAGLATAISLQAPFGTLWLEQTAIFFDLLALQCVVEGIYTSGTRKAALYLVAGVLGSLAILSKQNFGGLFVPILFLMAVSGDAPDWKKAIKSCLLIGVGLAVTITAFLAWVYLYSDFPTFVQRVLVVAGEIGKLRITKENLYFAVSLNVAPNLYQIDVVGFVAGIVTLPLALSSSWGKAWRELGPASLCAIALPWYRSFSQATTVNDWQNNLAFEGAATCIGISLLLRLSDYFSVRPGAGAPKPGLRIRYGFLVLLSAWALLCVRDEISTAWRRRVQSFPVGTVFTQRLQIARLERVYWGDPTPVSDDRSISMQDFDQLVAFLRNRRANFFVMGDSTLLYGVLGVPSPQPLLYFLPLHSYLPPEIPKLDPLVRESLVRNRVELIVREKETYLKEVAKSFPRFTGTWSWFQQEFEQVAEFGVYEVWQKRQNNSTAVGAR